ncbi:MAG: TfoX/Sxy family protein [Desulfosalsimonadaceae bacterium]|nr:TfoX/Sxy family protein [Desulfosalsimonadaceae bacterium]
MAYDQGLAQRIREIVQDMPGCVEKKMFGGLCYLMDGNMACGVYKEFLIVRVGIDDYESALMEPHTRKFDITGKIMKGWVMVDGGGYADDDDLTGWLRRGFGYAGSLPPK